jgi:hypothetical protein
MGCISMFKIYIYVYIILMVKHFDKKDFWISAHSSEIEVCTPKIE